MSYSQKLYYAKFLPLLVMNWFRKYTSHLLLYAYMYADAEENIQLNSIFPTMIERCNFTNPTVKVWADLNNPFKRSDYAKLCMSPSRDETLTEYVIWQEDNSPLTLYIDFHNL